MVVIDLTGHLLTLPLLVHLSVFLAALFTTTPYSLADPQRVPKLSLTSEPAQCHALTLPESGLT